MNFNILDRQAGQVVDRCEGPAPDGSCPRVRIGDVVACAQCLLVSADGGGTPYLVPGTATLCPVTLAESLQGQVVGSLAA